MTKRHDPSGTAMPIDPPLAPPPPPGRFEGRQSQTGRGGCETGE